MTAVKALQDNDGHWYVVPNSEAEEFSRLLDEASGKEDICSQDDPWDEFNDKFDQYRTGGDLNIVQLYTLKEGEEDNTTKAIKAGIDILTTLAGDNLEEFKAKAKKWDNFKDAIDRHYFHTKEDGSLDLEREKTGEESDLIMIGETAAIHAGYL